MASPKGVCLGLLLLILCIAHGSARNIISDDLIPDELKTQLNQEFMTAASEPEPDVVLASDLVKEDSHGSLEVANPPPSDEPTSLGDVQVACGHPACIARPRPLVPNCPTCGCVPAYSPIPYPYPRCEPAASPTQPEPFYPPQPEPLYPPQPEPLYPPQPQPSYPPHSEPFQPPEYEPLYPPQPAPLYPPQPAPAYPPQVSPGCQPAAPPQVSPGCQPACEPASPPQVSPGCQPACQPASPPQVSPGCQPASSPQVSPGCQPASPTQPEPTYPPWPEPAYPPQPEPFYPPQAEPANPPVTGPRVDSECLAELGRCPGSPTQNEVQQWSNEKPPPNEVMLESIREKEEGGSMNEQDWSISPSSPGTS